MSKPSPQPATGGSYIVENGVRRRVEEPTRDHPEGNCARESDGCPVGVPSATEPATEPAATARKEKTK